MVQAVLHRVNSNGLISFEPPKDLAIRSVLGRELKKCHVKNNDYVLCTFQPPKRPRTTGDKSQNNLFWFLVKLICDETGDSPADVEADLKIRAIAKGYPYHISKLTGKPVGESMTTVSTIEMSYLIDTAYEVIAFLGIIIPPEEVQ